MLDGADGAAGVPGGQQVEVPRQLAGVERRHAQTAAVEADGGRLGGEDVPEPLPGTGQQPTAGRVWPPTRRQGRQEGVSTAPSRSAGQHCTDPTAPSRV